MTYAETEFLLAEAAVRGWHSGDAAEHYANGVKAAMKLYGIYNAGFDIADEAIDAYLIANPFDASNAMEQIGNQVWLATIFNEYESFSNWRRTGFPVLNAVDYPGNEAGSQIPLRLRYPDSEYGINKENIEAAVARQGADQFTTAVWWDR